MSGMESAGLLLAGEPPAPRKQDGATWMSRADREIRPTKTNKQMLDRRRL
jgi:hypothetical protein